MKFNFKGYTEDLSSNSILEPWDIFDVLPNKNDEKYSYLRDIQVQVLKKWFDKRNDKNNLIKMNTGSGKTIVGLLILKSCLNDKKGPAVYVVPDKYLATQVINEARELGISVTDDFQSLDFKSGESILVINAYKLFNGKSVFGVNNIKQEIDSVIIDDAHACLDIIENQFSIEIPFSSKLSDELFLLFEKALKDQNDIKFQEMIDGNISHIISVPFWSWQSSREDFISIVRKYISDDSPEYKSLKFGWDLIKDNINLCNCVFGSKKIEISPVFLPIELIPSFSDANRKIFMSATMSDENVFVSHFNLKSDDLKEAIVPEVSSDVGERLILIPQRLLPQISDEQLKRYYKNLSTSYNVVVLVPSFYRSKFWEDCADKIVETNNISEVVNNLKKSHVGLTIIINKYDGIDLPKDACRILVLDGLPDIRTNIGKVKESILFQSKEHLKQVIQKIEQGMGRGVRSKDDYCVVFLMGRSLVERLYVTNAQTFFTTTTKAQLDLSNNVSQQLKETKIEDEIDLFKKMDDAISICLKRDTGWKDVSKQTLKGVTYNSDITINEQVKTERAAYNLAKNNQYIKAVEVLENYCNSIKADEKMQGYIKQEMARYEHFNNPSGAQEMLLSGIKLNSQIMHPINGVNYQKLIPSVSSQAQRLFDYFRVHFNNDTNNYILTMHRVIEDLQFKENTYNKFEEAIMELGKMIGFESERPEKNDYGPDNLWALGNEKYILIECKNECKASPIIKKDCSQLNSSIEWFKTKYNKEENLIPVIIHPSNEINKDAHLNKTTRILNADKLKDLISHLTKFSESFPSVCTDLGKLDRLIVSHNLSSDLFSDSYTVPFNRLLV
ncbi:DEAD/DEAH box helicase [Listeria monocytogenes]|nr:DEAD/DEAH box helicase [Listeria monocytogenes]